MLARMDEVWMDGRSDGRAKRQLYALPSAFPSRVNVHLVQSDQISLCRASVGSQGSKAFSDRE